MHSRGSIWIVTEGMNRNSGRISRPARAGPQLVEGPQRSRPGGAAVYRRSNTSY